MLKFLKYDINILNGMHLRGLRALLCFIKIISLPGALVIGILCHATSVHAHATVSLPTKKAMAGQTGTFTLTIPHGCGEGLATDRIVLTLSRNWSAVQPLSVDGWTTEVSRTAQMVGN